MVCVSLRIQTWRKRVPSEIWFSKTAVALLHLLSQVLGRASHRVASKHTEPCLERCRYVWSWRSVVQSDPAAVTIVELICYLWDAFIGSISGFEIEICRPII
jgi:hypothetical protein